MKIAIVYTSKSGFTKQYAVWLSEALSAPLLELKATSAEHLKGFDIIVYGGGLYAAGIQGLKELKSWLPTLGSPKLVVFATGATPDREDVVPLLIQTNFTPEEQPSANVFYFRGGFDFAKLTTIDKILMTLMKWKIQTTPAEKRTADQRGMLASYEHPANFCRKEAIEPLVNFVKI